MELAPGFSLDKYVNDDLWSALTEEQCGDIWLGAAEGLKWVHEKDYLHNDLKAENVMYDPGSRRTVLIDFGLAARYTPSSFRGGGTPCYVAPEYLSRQRFPVGDVWSLGVLIMFVSKLIQLPREEWELSKVFDGVTPDAQAMTDWIRRISATVKQARLPDADLLRRMVCIKHTERIASSELVSCLASTQQQAFTN
jgi:serine/threonine protein kinase